MGVPYGWSAWALVCAKVSKSPAPLRVFLTCMFDSVLQGCPAGA